ncbi:F-box associated domain-containing protein [Caenorhabditis elegans]|uniref:F-box associated domain-containing protein n=1 Tax=Caenorhabditis elegans TaxID=6239 RepID=Q9GYL7_CAEEL|nr:F-box associated domain-containing protein [Caenorhabditis elegans]CCD70305.2 F-box associated domain-containing protein [Caenorhabditis elegans]|eukprot:NP_494735.3 Uncharacterized protein CELE_R03H10.1 [Caenorhabditis elegans]
MAENQNENVAKMKQTENFEKWNNLPPEIKLMFTRTLDFETRTNLRNTASTEKSIVDIERFNFDRVQIFGSECMVEATKGTEGLFIGDSWTDQLNANQFIPALAFILTSCSIENLDVLDSRSLVNLDELNKQVPLESIQVKNFNADTHDDVMVSFLLDRCWKNVDSMELYPGTVQFLDKLPIIPSVMNTKRLKVKNNFDDMKPYHLRQFVENWITNDSEVGTKLEITFCRREIFDPVVFDFQSQNRKISENDGLVKITTENKEKNILLKFVPRDYLEDIKCVVIPSSVKEAEYEEWLNF